MDQDKGDGDSFRFPPEFRTTAAYAVQFPGAAGRNPTLVDPCRNDSPLEIPSSAIIAAMRGKRCVACTGTNWFLVLDEATRECFLTTLFTAPPPTTTTVVVPLPPMPEEDPPHLEEFLFNCVLSAPPSPAPGCRVVVVLGLIGETYLRYCRLGDEAWSRVDVTFDDYTDAFDGAVAFHGGKVYATTRASYCVVFDASSSSAAPAALHVERTDIKIPSRYPNNLAMRTHLVATASNEGGELLYFVRPYFFGFPEEVVEVSVCRWDASLGVWREVDGIGDTTLFVGCNSVPVVSPAREEGRTESNTIHILRSCYDGVRVFTFSLADSTIKCTFIEIEDEDEDNEDYDDKYSETDPTPETKAYWSVPSNCRFKFELPRQPSSEGGSQERSILQPNPPSKCLLQWHSLPTDLLAEHVVPKLSFIDFLHLKSVCKEWSGISTPMRETKAWPLLVTPSTSSGNGGSLDVFDPVTKNKYTLSMQVPSVTVPGDDDDLASLILHCSKNGWLIVSRGQSFFLMNPFKRGDDAMIMLPPVNELFWFKGISFRSTPGSPDFMVMIVEGITNQEMMDTIKIRTWRHGQESWEEHEGFDCEVRFVLATHNPLFLDGEFYCMTRDGKLGAFNPKTMAWRVLDGLEPIHTESYVLGEGWLREEGLYAYPVEWKGEVIAVFHDKDVQEPIEMFRFDHSRMAWEKLEGLEEGAMFWDRKQAIASPSSSLAQSFNCNKVYVPAFTDITSGGATYRECVSYSMETKEFSNGSCSLYGLKEPIKAIWLQPNLDYYE